MQPLADAHPAFCEAVARQPSGEPQQRHRQQHAECRDGGDPERDMLPQRPSEGHEHHHGEKEDHPREAFGEHADQRGGHAPDFATREPRARDIAAW